jgi:hypothetical protein
VATYFGLDLQEGLPGVLGGRRGTDRRREERRALASLLVLPCLLGSSSLLLGLYCAGGTFVPVPQRPRHSHASRPNRSNSSASGGDGAHMLALRRRPRLEAVEFAGLEDKLGATLANGAGQGHDVNHVRPTPQDSHRGHHDSRPTEPSLAAAGHPEVEVDNITRRQHPATPSRR